MPGVTPCRQRGERGPLRTGEEWVWLGSTCQRTIRVRHHPYRWMAWHRGLGLRAHGVRCALHWFAVRRLHLEKGDELPQRLCLRVDGFASSRSFFHQGSVLLRHLVHLHDCLVDLLDAGGLLLAGQSDLRDDIADFFDCHDNLVQGLARSVYESGPPLDFLDTVADQRLDFLRCLGTALGQLPHLGGDHGKAPPLVASAGRFDSGVEGEQIGLKGDAIDHPGNISDFFAAVADLYHRPYGLADHLAPLLRLGPGVGRQLIGLARVVGVLLHRAVHLFHAGRRLFQGRGLFLRALVQFGIALHNLTRRIRDIARRLPNLPDDLPQLLAHALHGLQQATGFIPCRHHDVVVEFTSGNAFRHPHRQRHRPRDATRHPEGTATPDQQYDGAQDEHQQTPTHMVLFGLRTRRFKTLSLVLDQTPNGIEECLEGHARLAHHDAAGFESSSFSQKHFGSFAKGRRIGRAGFTNLLHQGLLFRIRYHTVELLEQLGHLLGVTVYAFEDLVSRLQVRHQQHFHV